MKENLTTVSSAIEVIGPSKLNLYCSKGVAGLVALETEP